MNCKNCGKPIRLNVKAGTIANLHEDLYIHTDTNEYSCFQGKVGGERAEPEVRKKIQRDTKEFFDWWYERIDKFEKMYPWAFVSSWGSGVGIQIRGSEFSTHVPEIFFLKMIGEDKFWWEY